MQNHVGKEQLICRDPPWRWRHFWRRNPQNVRNCPQCKSTRSFRTRRRTPNTSPDKFSQLLGLGTALSRTGSGQAPSEAIRHQMSLIPVGQEQALNLPGKCWAGAIPAWGLLWRNGMVEGAEEGMEREKTWLAPGKMSNGLEWLRGSEHKENCCLIRTAEPWQGDSSGRSPSLVSRCFRRDWTGNGVSGGLCESQADSSPECQG